MGLRIDVENRGKKIFIPLAKYKYMLYNKYRKSTHSKVDAPEDGYLALSESRPSRWQTGWALFFSLVFSVEKGKQRNEQTSKRY